MEEYARKVATGEYPVVGVNCFQMDEEPYNYTVFRPDPNAGKILAERLEKLRKTRNQHRVRTSLARLREVSKTSENVMPAVIEAAESLVTLGEIVDVWRDLYGIWNPPVAG
jgi:methylmalonyl-CoA mutase N-terminal domain/subunit